MPFFDTKYHDTLHVFWTFCLYKSRLCLQAINLVLQCQNIEIHQEGSVKT